MPCRGRDRPDLKWDYGFGTKKDRGFMHFVYRSGDEETFPISGILFGKLVQLEIADRSERSSAIQRHPRPSTAAHNLPTLILAHGLSPDVGPHYPLIQHFQERAQKKGWKVIVLDFRETYGNGTLAEYTSAWSHAWRVSIVQETMRKVASQGGAVVLVGHSQGGAACARACSADLANEVDIRGLMMIGSEYPHKAPHCMSSRPVVNNIEIVHAEGDAMIPIEPMYECARLWKCHLIPLKSQVPKGAHMADGDDINHEFLAEDLMLPATQHFASFLDKCK